MMARNYCRLYLAACLVWPLSLMVNAQDAAPALRVMSFNIRYGTANDGENHWDRRKEFLAETIQSFSPDLLGTQETVGFQKDFLAAQLPEYENLGVGRADGGAEGEMMALFYRRDRFEQLDSGHFWLSNSPATVGSISWDSSLPRMVTWVKLRDRRSANRSPIAFFNTHFDHRGPVARQESAKLLRNKIHELAAGESVIVTGDFNTGEGSKPYRTMFAEANGTASPLVDSYRTVYPTREKNEGTISSFKADSVFGPRIDWIGLSRDWQILKAGIDRTSKAGATPSDHFPVTAVIQRSSKLSTSK